MFISHVMNTICIIVYHSLLLQITSIGHLMDTTQFIIIRLGQTLTQRANFLYTLVFEPHHLLLSIFILFLSLFISLKKLFCFEQRTVTM